ncbi:hypothetical protein OG439_30565 [Amycolatopsis sp. NBC_01307]|uniref:effector-associated domain 2-containing protein n=1 Tax=Amycolatopsis sp. NBC_01307 TaxID=2903561 RepID=UPI002E0EDB9B|nr:hypothetical protein OG439_30565 [Amycolatopsis sp. NBC_01307]
MDSAAYHKTVMALDIAGYNDPRRTAAHRLVVHEGFWRLLRTSFAAVGVPWVDLFQENAGDGAMIQLPAQVAKADLVAELPDRMLAELRRYNAVHAEEANVQLRVAFHAGEIHQGSHGTVGDATSHAFRLVEAPEAKNALKLSGATLALIVSDSFYHDVVRADPAANAGSYRRMRVSVKETKTEAWLRLLGAAVNGFPGRELPPPSAVEDVFSALVDALLAVPCVRGAESRRLLLDHFSRREIADLVPHHAEDRLHVIALARTCRRFTRGLADLLEAIRMLDPGSPQVDALAAIIDRL